MLKKCLGKLFPGAKLRVRLCPQPIHISERLQYENAGERPHIGLHDRIGANRQRFIFGIDKDLLDCARVAKLPLRHRALHG